MNRIHERFKREKVGSIFLYTHEAHPGENYQHLTSMDLKYKHAEALRDILGVSRPIYLDALDGACHRAFGSMPNMTWIFNRAGTVLYKSEWSDARSAESAVEYYLDVNKRRRNREQLVPFLVDRIDYRTRDNDGFNEGLLRSGSKAVKEYDEAF